MFIQSTLYMHKYMHMQSIFISVLKRLTEYISTTFMHAHNMITLFV
jgi:hypothetical protein